MSYRDRLLSVGLLMLVTGLLAYGAPLPREASVTVAFVGTGLAMALGRWLEKRHGELEREETVPADAAGNVDAQ